MKSANPDQSTSPKVSIWKQFPGAFWCANVMEIFERMGWYGFYAVSSLYLTGAVVDGGLGLSSEDRGVIQGLATFFLYLFPAVFGALADRYGFRNMFLASCAVMIPGYLLLGIPNGFWGFLAVYFLVAVGHGMFKPVVISTVAKSTTEKTGSMGFGIFYMMVNVGGFLGPIVAGVIRGWDWQYVFYASATWILFMGVITLLFYREPPRDAEAESRRSLNDVFRGMIEVVGNGRFFLLIAGLLLLLVMGSKWLGPREYLPAAGTWLGLNLFADVLLRRREGSADGFWLLQPMKIGEGRYLVFLVLMAFFWTSFNQIFMTLPEYIRDYADTSDLIRALTPAAVSITNIAQNIGLDTSEWGRAVLEHGQVKPEHLINLNALGIIVGQVAIAYLVRKLQPLTTIIVGSFVTVISFLLYLIGQGGWIIVIAILVFSVGEMLASPRSKEYAGRIAPPHKVGMYMGYFYWCVALGNLFGGLLSGGLYQHFGPVDRGGVDNTNAMWLIFAGLALASVVLLSVYDRWVKSKPQESEQAV
ncbi:MAG: MFS transporter [Candidatus Latescibacterota bacterium]|nr:MAG: MFS transporter [Candidatus Latescibacterota bacterium]